MDIMFYSVEYITYILCIVYNLQST